MTRLTRAWHAHSEVPPIPADEDDALYAQRLVAQRCLYGLDKNQMAADLAKLSLWLATLARNHAFTFLDHSLRHGDALVGLTRKQIASFNWIPAAQQSFLEEKIRQLVEFVSRQRREILEARENTPYAQLEQELTVADDQLSLPRMIGDAAIAAFFSAEKPKQREEARNRLLACIEADLKKQGFISVRGEVDRAIHALRKGANGITPFHWELEFPEVFTADGKGDVTGGFHVIVGNPPFLGGARISTNFGMAYFSYLTTSYSPAGHQCDLVGYFFRRAFTLAAKGGTLGLVATKTIAQGDTRDGALEPILANGGSIFSAARRLKWPGEAAVYVSPIHIAKDLQPPALLDGRPTARISAFLLAGSIDESPKKLASSPFFSKGSQIYGQGFLFDDSDDKANPLSLMNEIVSQEPCSRERIFPFIGGEELNSQPVLHPNAHVINVSDLREESELAAYPRLAEIIRQKVKPERDILGDNPNNRPLKKRWWAYQAHRPELYERLKNRRRVLAHAEISGHLAFQFVPTGWIYNKTVILIDLDTFAAFGMLQCRVHEAWVRLTASTLKTDLRYTASDCFETFPCLAGHESSSALEQAGKAYYDFRADLMVRNHEGLTKTYNRFHDPNQESSDIQRLRDLHGAMDRAVLEAYGWTDIQAVCDFSRSSTMRRMLTTTVIRIARSIATAGRTRFETTFLPDFSS